MTTMNAAREAVYSRWVAQWGTTSPFTFDNEAFDTPAVAWARVTIRHTGSAQETLGETGNRRFRRSASVFVQLYGLVDRGTSVLDTLATTARGIFEGVSFSGLDFTNAVVRESGNDGKWFQYVVEAFFDYEETK